MAKSGRVGAALELRGIEKTLDAMNLLEVKVQERVLTGAIKKAAKPFVKAARQRVPRETGLLKFAMGSVTKKYKKAHSAVAIEVMGPRRNVAGKKAETIRGQAGNASREPANYAHLVEFGTGGHTIQPKRGAALGTPDGPFAVVDVEGARPQPFMRNAWSATQRRMEMILHVQLSKRVAKAAEDARRQSRERKTRAVVKGTQKLTAKGKRGVGSIVRVGAL